MTYMHVQSSDGTSSHAVSRDCFPFGQVFFRFPSWTEETLASRNLVFLP